MATKLVYPRIALALGILALSSVLVASGRVATAPPSGGENAVEPRTTPRSPMMTEIDALLKSEREICARLHAAVLIATDENEAQRLQRQIEAIKRGTEIEILQTQLHYARAEGRHLAVKALTLSLETLMTHVQED